MNCNLFMPPNQMYVWVTCLWLLTISAGWLSTAILGNKKKNGWICSFCPVLVQVQCPLSDICFGGGANVVLTLISCLTAERLPWLHGILW